MNSVAGQNSSSTWNKIEKAAVQNQSANFYILIGVSARESSWRQVKIDLDCYVSVRKLELQRGK